jgi:hypothetical protein
MYSVLPKCRSIPFGLSAQVFFLFVLPECMSILFGHFVQPLDVLRSAQVQKHSVGLSAKVFVWPECVSIPCGHFVRPECMSILFGHFVSL